MRKISHYFDSTRVERVERKLAGVVVAAHVSTKDA